MTLAELKAKATAMGITTEAARQYGHIGHKVTWQAAIDAVTQSATEAQQPAQETAEAVTDALYSTTSRAVAQWMATAILMVVFTLGLITVRITQAVWQATEPLRSRAVGRIHSEFWAFVGAWPDLLIGL